MLYNNELQYRVMKREVNVNNANKQTEMASGTALMMILILSANIILFKLTKQ